MINHKETRMVKDEEDWNGLQTTNLKNLRKMSRYATPFVFVTVRFG